MHNSANFAGPRKGALHTQLVIMLKHCFFYLLKMNTTQFRPVIFFYILWSKGQTFFPQLWVARLFILFTKTARPPPPPHPAESNSCPQNKPGNKRTKLYNGWCHNNGGILWTNNRIFDILFLVDFYFLL